MLLLGSFQKARLTCLKSREGQNNFKWPGRGGACEGEGFQLTLRKIKLQVKRAVHSMLDNHVGGLRQGIKCVFYFYLVLSRIQSNFKDAYLIK